MKQPEVNITRGPWPAAIAEQLATRGILRWQVLKRHYGTRPEVLAAMVPGTSAQDWVNWLGSLPAVPERPERTYPMGLIPTNGIRDNEVDRKELDHGDDNDTANLG